MEDQKLQVQIKALMQLVRQARDIEISDEKCALFSLVLVEGRLYPAIFGNSAVLTDVLKVAARNSDDFKGLLLDAVNDLGGTERQQELESELSRAASNFSHIAEIAERLTSGNVSHDGRTILGIARRNEEYMQKIIKQE